MPARMSGNAEGKEGRRGYRMHDWDRIVVIGGGGLRSNVRSRPQFVRPPHSDLITRPQITEDFNQFPL